MVFAYVFVVTSFLIAEVVMLASSFMHFMYGVSALFIGDVPGRKANKTPKVTVLIPVYNEGKVARLAIEGALKLDYPKNRLQIIVVDDSNDGITPKIISEYPVKHLRRPSRKGFKAGALNHGLAHATGEIIVILDADFVPEREFLRKVISEFERDAVAVVQGKWKYRNEDRNFVSKSAGMMNDAFYGGVMRFRNSIGTVIFSGSGGALRKKYVLKVGRFNEDAISEDLDLSLRLMIDGYETRYAENTVSNGEAPTNFWGFVKQQTRWAFGTTQAFLRYAMPILFSKNLNPLQKFELFMSTAGYVVSPFIVLLYIAGAINFFTRWVNPSIFIWVVITLAGLGYFFEVAVGISKSNKRMSALLHIPILFLVLALLNFPLASGVLKAVAGKKIEFLVTPKTG